MQCLSPWPCPPRTFPGGLSYSLTFVWTMSPNNFSHPFSTLTAAPISRWMPSPLVEWAWPLDLLELPEREMPRDFQALRRARSFCFHSLRVLSFPWQYLATALEPSPGGGRSQDVRVRLPTSLRHPDWGCRRNPGCPSCLTNFPNLLLTLKTNGDLLQKVTCTHCCTQCPRPCSRPPHAHTSTGDCWTLTGKSRSVSCGVSAAFSWVLVCTRFCLCPPRVCFPSPV